MEKRDAQDALQAWAICALARWAKVEQNLVGPPVGIVAERLGNYGCALRNDWKLDATGESLLPIFSLIEPPLSYEGSPYHPDPVPTRRLNPADLLNSQPESPSELWRDLAAEYDQLPKGEARFEAFGHLLHKYAWAAPCTYGEVGVSLYQEFKALAGLMAASGWADGPVETYTLVGGDLSGIQDFIYTITSKGAAKGLRGRSFFLQLIGDAVVRRIVADLGLCWANVVYQAGGNFMLLAPDGNMTTQAVDDVRRRVNTVLIEAFQADLFLVMDSEPIARQELFLPEIRANEKEPEKGFLARRKALGAKLDTAKRQPIRGLESDWSATFRPRGQDGLTYCEICHKEPEIGEKLTKDRGEAGEVTLKCALCVSFEKLAREIGRDPLYMSVRRRDSMRNVSLNKREDWRMLLTKMTGFTYRFYTSPKQCPPGDIEAINNLDFLASNARCFRVLANTTPRVTEIDIEYLKNLQYHEKRSDTEAGKPSPQGKAEEKLPSIDDIRSFNLLAHAASESGAIERVGVLRMDLDGLGRTFSTGVPKLTLPVLSALSEAFELFIGGYLNTLAHTIGGNDVYIIYAGGDDLFIVGAWHRLPDLAEAIQRDLKTYTGGHPALSISGGLTLEDAHFPLYRAAERSDAAEHAAKDYVRPKCKEDDNGNIDHEAAERAARDCARPCNGGDKNAFCFLGTVVGWEEWGKVREQKDNLLWLIGEDADNLSKPGTERDERLPRSLLQLVQNLHALYRTGLHQARKMWREGKLKREPQAQLYLGRWVWMQAYTMSRLAHTVRDDAAKKRLEALRQAILSKKTVRLSRLAAKWAEFLTRQATTEIEPDPFDNVL